MNKLFNRSFFSICMLLFITCNLYTQNNTIVQFPNDGSSHSFQIKEDSSIVIFSTDTRGNFFFSNEGASSPQNPMFPNLSVGNGWVMWLGAKTALRNCIMDTASFWNDEYMGYCSMAAGRNTIAQGDYSAAFGNATYATGDYSIAAGFQTHAEGNLSAAFGYNNIASSAYSFTSGMSNTSSGTNSVTFGKYSTASGANSTAIGAYSTAAGDYSIAVGRRAKNQDVAHDGVFIFADGNNYDFESSAANQFRARATGGVQFITSIDGSGNPNAGVQVASGGGSWSAMSDRNVKENFSTVDGRSILALVTSIPIRTWNYKSQDKSIRHIGPMAQDFYAAFKVGEDDKHITTIDADGVALAAIQGLKEIVMEKDVKISELEKRIEKLEQIISSSTTSSNSSIIKNK
jgi:hypothetical protein